MPYVSLRSAIERGIELFRRNQSAAQPLVSVWIPAALSDFLWPDQRLKQFIRLVLYESLSNNNPNSSIEVTATRHARLEGLDHFVGVHPSYWLELRLSGPGFRMAATLVEELFNNMGYRCEEWVGTEASGTRLGIFALIHSPDHKIVIFLDSSHGVVNSDFLFPIHETYAFSPSLKHDVKAAIPQA